MKVIITVILFIIELPFAQIKKKDYGPKRINLEIGYGLTQEYGADDYQTHFVSGDPNKYSFVPNQNSPDYRFDFDDLIGQPRDEPIMVKAGFKINNYLDIKTSFSNLNFNPRIRIDDSTTFYWKINKKDIVLQLAIGYWSKSNPDVVFNPYVSFGVGEVFYSEKIKLNRPGVKLSPDSFLKNVSCTNIEWGMNFYIIKNYFINFNTLFQTRGFELKNPPQPSGEGKEFSLNIGCGYSYIIK